MVTTRFFCKSKDCPPYFTNRGKIFYKDGPSKDGFYGIWTWSATPNEKDPSKDYILSRYNMNIDAIEVITISDASDLDGLINSIKNGIECQLHSRKVMFSFYKSNDQYAGVLCNAKTLNTVNGRIAFSEDCVEVPVYEFFGSEILRFDNGLSFYRDAFAGLPQKLYQLKSPLAIVKNVVCSSISWATYKTRAVTRTEYRTFKDFLETIPVDDIMRKIETACRCSNSHAKELLDEFMSVVWKYIDGNSLEDEIILSAISASIELQERTKALIRTDWEAENKRLLDEAQKKLDSLDAQLKSTAIRLTEEQEAINKTKLEEKRLSDIIAEKEKLAEAVEAAIGERIQKARENVADFIANMAFVGGQPIQAGASEIPATIEVSHEPAVVPYHVVSASENLNDLEAHHSWADVINTAILELGEAGVTEKYRSGLAAFLCAAYIEKQPLLLVGPNAIDVIQAFCAAVTGHKYGMLCCEGSYSNQRITEIGADGEDIVIINNLLASGWMNRLPEILSQKDILYVATHPYVEDIQVEPKSLYGFMLPLFTEFFVDKKATGKYYGGYFAADFKTYSTTNSPRKDLRILSKLNLNSLVRNRINRLVSTMCGIHTAITVDDEFLFTVFPVAYASMKINKLEEAITDPQKSITISESLRRDLQDVLGEV